VLVETDLASTLRRRFDAAGISLSAQQQDQLTLYFGLMAKWNNRLNLTSLRLEPLTDEAVDRLIIEPAIAASAIAESDELLVDVGSGGGSPAIPLKVCLPRLGLTMVESRSRKAAFLRDVVRKLELANVDVANCRFSQVARRAHLQSNVDIVSLRAVKADRAMWDDIRRLLRHTGRVFHFSSTASVDADRSGLAVSAALDLPRSARLHVLSRT
jgi:16S rRNA (guanine527-N7)-methyltransferase